MALVATSAVTLEEVISVASDESPENQGRLRKAQRFHGTVVEEKEVFRAGDDFVESVSRTPPVCAQGHVMHKQEQIGGQCACGAWLCVECARLRCALDGRVVCESHAERDGDRVLCVFHPPARRFTFFLLGW